MHDKKGVIKIRRNYLVPIILGLILILAVGYWGYTQYQTRNQLEIYLGNKYQQAFYQMLENVEQIQVLLGKSLVSASPSQNILTLNEIWRNADIAQAELNKLPISEEALYKTAKFLNQTGDYAHVMAKKNAEGSVLSQKNRKELEKLKNQSIQLSTALHDLERKISSGKMSWIEVVRGTRSKLKEGQKSLLDSNFSDIEQDLTKYPTLIYDGPFSDHITEAKPKGDLGRKVTMEKAREKAINVITQQIGGKPKVTASQTVKGRIPAYSFELTYDENKDYVVDVSINGGHVLNYIGNRNVGNVELDRSTAAEKGKQFLAVIGYPNMQPTYAETRENIAYISYAYNQEDVIIYPDIINLQVALDNGEIMAVEALSYLMSHHKRDIEKPEISINEAKRLVSNRFDKIDHIQLAVIPRPGLNELLTYEVRGIDGNEEYLVYLDTKNGEEKQILQLIKENNGTFAI